MQGDIDNPKNQGIIPRMVSTVFKKIEEAPVEIEFTVNVSMIEIYMENINDLIDPSKKNLKIFENDVKKG